MHAQAHTWKPLQKGLSSELGFPSQFSEARSLKLDGFHSLVFLLVSFMHVFLM